MKKLSSLFVLLLLMITLAGCSTKEEPTPEDVVVTPETQDPETGSGLETEEDTTNTGDLTFEAAKKELELISQ